MQKILLIEDDGLLRRTLRAALKNNNFQMFEASDGREALKIAQEHKIDIILCDLNLGETDGEATLGILARNPATANIPLLPMTGNASDAAHLDQVLLKPFTIEELLKHLQAPLKTAVRQRESVAEQKETFESFLNVNKSHETQLSLHQLEKILRRNEIIREEEKSRLARRIHDDLTQKLTVLAIDLSLLQSEIKSPGEGMKLAIPLKKVQDLGALVNEIIRSAQDITSELRPKVLDEFGLIAALEWLSQNFEKQHGIKCAFRNSIGDDIPQTDLAEDIYRLSEATLCNIGQNSGASLVSIHIQENSGIFCMNVIENGMGMTAEDHSDPNALGWLPIRERIQHLRGSFSVKAEPGKGTAVYVQIPLQSNFVK